jgi:hypothetical protein
VDIRWFAFAGSGQHGTKLRAPHIVIRLLLGSNETFVKKFVCDLEELLVRE